MADPKLLWNPDNVRDVAESVGISSLNDDAVRALSQEVEYRLGQVIEEAKRFMSHGKRTVLTTQDISQALKVLDVEPLYGYESTRPLRFGEASLGPGQPLFYIEDEEVDFEKLINAPLPKVPRDISFTGMCAQMIFSNADSISTLVSRRRSPTVDSTKPYHGGYTISRAIAQRAGRESVTGSVGRKRQCTFQAACQACHFQGTDAILR